MTDVSPGGFGMEQAEGNPEMTNIQADADDGMRVSISAEGYIGDPSEMAVEIGKILIGPKRAWTAEISLGADSKEELLAMIRHMSHQWARSGVPMGNGAMGGPSSGWSYLVKHDPDMTHEKYHRLVQEFLDAEKEDDSGKD